MVKSLADILAEIEERNSILGFSEGGTPDGEDPNDPDTSEDTGPSNDDGDDGDEDYQGKAMLNYEEDYGKAEGEEQEFWENQLKDAITLERKDIPRSLINERTVSKETNQELMEAGKNEDEGFFGKGVNPLASLIESIVYGLTFGAVDLQLDKGDMFGKDFSTGKTQPQGTAQISVPAIGGPLSVMGLAQMALPSYEVDLTGQGRSQVVGTPSDKANQIAEVFNEVKSEVEEYGNAIQNAVLGTGSGTQVAGTNQAINEQGKVMPESTLTKDDLLNIVADNSSKTGLPHEQGLGLVDDGEVPFIPTITNAMVDNAIAPVEDKEAAQIASWNWNPETWYPSAQGGAINAFSVGGLAGMMMPRQQQSKSLYFNDTPGRGSTRYNPFTGGSPNVPTQFGGQLPPPPPQFPGFLGPFGPQRPPLQPPQRPKLDAETYFHTHEGGKVAYPNFPQPFINKEDTPNPAKNDPRKPDPMPLRPFQTYPQVQALDEAYNAFNTNQMDAVEQGILQGPVPPISISETTATAMQPEEVQETQATTIEEAPVPKEIDIQMPENITATLDFPEQVTGTANYARGGLTNILRNLAPYAAGYLAGPFGYIPGAIAGAGTQYALAGKKRGGLDAIKGMLAGMSGVGVGRVGEAYASNSNITPGPNSKTSLFQDQFKKGEMGESIFNMPENYGERLGQQGSGIWEALATGRGDVYKAVGSELIGPASLGLASASITPPSQMPEFTEVEVEQIKTMTPEQRKAYLAQKRMQYANKPSMRTQTFAPPNVDIGFDVTTAADGGVMEIDEEMESGSFVLPADVVSNVGDGSSDAGHRRLAQLFGGGDEYALGGGTGILKGPIKGPGGGLDDLIQTGIDGVRVARLSTDEFVVPKDVVRKLGDGSQKAGSEKLYDFMKDVRLKKHGTTEQPKEMHMSGLRKMV